MPRVCIFLFMSQHQWYVCLLHQDSNSLYSLSSNIPNNVFDPTLPNVELMISTAPVMPKNSWIKTVVKIAQVKRELMMREGLILRRMSNSRKDRWLFIKIIWLTKIKWERMTSVPRPVLPKKPVAWHSSMKIEAPYLETYLQNENWCSLLEDRFSILRSYQE